MEIGRLDAQIVALRPHCARTVLEAPPQSKAPQFFNASETNSVMWDEVIIGKRTYLGGRAGGLL